MARALESMIFYFEKHWFGLNSLFRGVQYGIYFAIYVFIAHAQKPIRFTKYSKVFIRYSIQKTKVDAKVISFFLIDGLSYL